MYDRKKNRRIMADVPLWMFKLLLEKIKQDGLSVADHIRIALRKYLEN